jgi:hypothetical protein
VTPAVPGGLSRRRRLSRAPRRAAEVHPGEDTEKVSLAKKCRLLENAARRRRTFRLNILVGPEGYKGIVARQLQQFKRVQKERAAAAAPESTE